MGLESLCSEASRIADIRQPSKNGDVNGQGFRYAGERERLKFETLQIVSCKTPLLRTVL